MNQKTTKKNNKSAQGKSSPVKTTTRTQKQKQNLRTVVIKDFDVRPASRGRKSSTGAFYGGGFDAVSKPERDSVRVEAFDELITSVNGSVAFAIAQYPCNPGNATVFPRLSQFAKLYEKYQFEQLEFYFQHDVSQFATQGANGLVILSGLYDAASATPSSKSQVEVTDPHVICMPNQNSLLKFSPKKLHPHGQPLFVRPGILPGGTDIKTYDAANMYLSTQGMAGATEVGELHVRGRVRLIGDILDASSAKAPVNTRVSSYGCTSEVLTSTVELLLPIADIVNGLSAVNTSGSIVIPAGNYLVLFRGRFTFAGASTAVSLTLYKNGSAVDSLCDMDYTSANVTVAHLSGFRFETSDGDDIYTLRATGTFSTSTGVVSANLLFQAL